MRKVKTLSILFFVGVFLSSIASGGTLYDSLSKKDMVKVYVADISDETGKGKADLAGLKKTLEAALEARMSIKFSVVKKKEDADIIINSKIDELLWTDDDPVDMITGVGSILMDALKKENYGRMQVKFNVTDAKTGKVMWKDKEKATITDKKMTEEDSVGMLNDRIVQVFMRDCFSKARGIRK